MVCLDPVLSKTGYVPGLCNISHANKNRGKQTVGCWQDTESCEVGHVVIFVLQVSLVAEAVLFLLLL